MYEMHPIHYSVHQRKMKEVCKALNYVSMLQEYGYAVEEAERAWRIRVPLDCIVRGECRAVFSDALDWTALGLYCDDDQMWTGDCSCPCHNL